MDRVVLYSPSGVQPVYDRFTPRAGCVGGFPGRRSRLAGCSSGLVYYAVAAGQKPHRRLAASIAEFASGGHRCIGHASNPGPDFRAGGSRAEARRDLAIATERPAPNTIGGHQ
jgi:hypothetical protein